MLFFHVNNRTHKNATPSAIPSVCVRTRQNRHLTSTANIDGAQTSSSKYQDAWILHEQGKVSIAGPCMASGHTINAALAGCGNTSKAVRHHLVQQATWRQRWNLLVEERGDVGGRDRRGQEGHGAVDDDAVPVDVLFRLTGVHYGLQKRDFRRFQIYDTKLCTSRSLALRAKAHPLRAGNRTPKWTQAVQSSVRVYSLETPAYAPPALEALLERPFRKRQTSKETQPVFSIHAQELLILQVLDWH